MSDLMNVNLEDHKPAELLDDGTYPLTITYCGMRRSTKEGTRPFISMMLQSDDEDKGDVSAMMSFPIDSDEKRTVRMMMDQLVEFCETASLDKTEFMNSCRESLADLDGGAEKVRVSFIEGSSVECKVKTEADQNGVDRSVVDRFIR